MMNNLTITISVDQSPAEVFAAVSNVRGWWTENTVGKTSQLNDEFEVRFADIHYSKQKLVEVVTNKKVVWLITESNLSFIKDKSEWTNTRVEFDISQKGSKTLLRFTHVGLAPQVECYEACSNAWSEYISGSLHQLISTGKGQPTLKEIN